ncbi:MAG: BamA/TamA family outer membrane protein [Bacteroidota bacterium]
MTSLRFIALGFLSVWSLESAGQSSSTDSTKRSASWVIYPAFGFQPETSFQFGAIGVGTLQSSDDSQSDFVRQSSFTPFAIYTLRNQILAAFNVDYFFRSGWNLNITPRFFKFPDRYFGIGNDNDPDEFEDYTNEFWRLEGQLSIPQTPRIFWGVAFDMRTAAMRGREEGGDLLQGDVTGWDGGAQVGLGPAVRYDSRDNAIYPTRGYFINAQSLITYLGDFGFTSYNLDVRRYFSIRDDRDVVAVQLNGFFTTGSDIPFYTLPQLGGDERVRGIANASLYRDRQAVYGQVEYRKYLFWRIGGVAFAAVGDVANQLGDLDLSEFKYAGGVGVRYQVLPDQKLNVRFDIGVARGGQTAFYIGMREAF